MSSFSWNALLALVWAASTADFSASNLALGFLLGFALLFLLQGVTGQSSYFRKLPKAFSFAAYFFWELARANLRVACDVVLPLSRLRPGVVAVPLDVETDGEITWLVSLIALTPGTIALDVSDDRKVLFVHAISVDDPEDLCREIKNGFERRILELLR